jgi:hypothetical protein
VHPQREEKLRKALFCVFKLTDLCLGQITQGEERLKEKNVKCPNLKFIEIFLRRIFTERRKTKKKLFVFHADQSSSRVDYTERIKTERVLLVDSKTRSAVVHNFYMAILP